ncbi:hypothetical protein HanXRQr2_Chr11g0472591 [Helianthus annuus]|uniref:Uncharacterized protein n=1 Tax=Helianthus annuus TaxID=4232 RepID=A0A9K3MYM7_HELAN|nr:hypothetical protein HanXRQr2_Chr11g0472591 [Helianthus annuus]KAJ0873723.1 hypothetical protein HanPSC8_Chr11g0455751 [Helianthus annuus]
MSKHHPVRNPKVSLILILDQWEKKVSPCQLAHSDNQKPPGVQSLHPRPQGAGAGTNALTSFKSDEARQLLVWRSYHMGPTLVSINRIFTVNSMRRIKDGKFGF